MCLCTGNYIQKKYSVIIFTEYLKTDKLKADAFRKSHVVNQFHVIFPAAPQKLLKL